MTVRSLRPLHALLPVLAAVTAAGAADAQTTEPETLQQMAQVQRRPGPSQPLPAPPEPPADPTAVTVPPPTAFPGDFIPVPDRWRLMENFGVNENYLDPYNQNTLKGDRPIFGEDWFINLSAISDTVIEPRSTPVPVGIQSAPPGSNDVFGDTEQFFGSQTVITSASLIKGDTAFRPPDIEARLTLAFNYNYAWAQEERFLDANPLDGHTRTDYFLGVQEAFLDYHIRNVSERFDFDSIRVGIQPFSTDFRGFLFQDNQLGVRLFGTRANNLYQYNLAWFRRIEKDTNSGLNDLGEDIRKDDVFIANLYRQDFPVIGMTSQATLIYNRNRDNEITDKNGFPARPEQFGVDELREYDVVYPGLNFDGRLGRINLTASIYGAIGENKNSALSGEDTDVRAFFAAAEPSIDFDWVRLKLSGLYASGDDDPYDGTDEGFDAIFENPQFAGADTSYFIRQAVPLIGGGFVQLSGRNAVLPALRSSKEQGQSNFTNPGLTLLGTGADFDILPELRLSLERQLSAFQRDPGVGGDPPAGRHRQRDRLGPVGGDHLAAVQYPECRFPPIGRHPGRGRGLQAALRHRRRLLLFRPREPRADLLGAAVMFRLSHITVLALLLAFAPAAYAAEGAEKPREITYAVTPPAPRAQAPEEAARKSAGCLTCHTTTDAASMHRNPGVVLGCTDCHGGNAEVKAVGVGHQDPQYLKLTEEAHVLPTMPETWHYPSSANPKQSYTLLNKESPEYIRFVNPSDYRVVRESCGACHQSLIHAAERSLMATGAMLWGGASYNNGILPYKNYLLGEAYTQKGEPAKVESVVKVDQKMKARGVLEALYPLPAWETVPPADPFRIFERGGRNIISQFPEIGLPNAAGQLQRLEEPGRPDIRQSNRGPGTGVRVAIPVLNITKTRLNDPFTWFLGTNDQPGDYRTSGCGSCHVVYANDRDPRHSGPYAAFGHWGTTQTKPTRRSPRTSPATRSSTSSPAPSRPASA